MTKLKQLGGQIQAVVTLLLLVLSTSILFIPVLVMGLLKLFPNQRWRSFCTKIIDRVAVNWCRINNFFINKTQTVDWQVSGVKNLSTDRWYLLIANHQTWLDIVVLMHVFTDKIPVLKFFIKDQLKWIPLLGFTWWAMGCPFMKRYTKEYLQKNPHKRDKDLNATRKAIESFRHNPATIINFVEGTRFTEEKKNLQQSPYQHLLKPKAGGISFIINAMGEQIHSLLDVSIMYPRPGVSLWDFLSRRVKKIKVQVQEVPIPVLFTEASLIDDEKTQQQFRHWLNERWGSKDRLIDEQAHV